MSENKKVYSVSISLTPQVSEIRDSLENDSLSTVISRRLARYKHIISESCGLSMQDVDIARSVLENRIIDTVTAQFLHNEFYKHPELQDKIKKLTISQKYSMIEKIGK